MYVCMYVCMFPGTSVCLFEDKFSKIYLQKHISQHSQTLQSVIKSLKTNSVRVINLYTTKQFRLIVTSYTLTHLVCVLFTELFNRCYGHVKYFQGSFAGGNYE